MTEGSSRLTQEQVDWYRERYGIRPTVVPDRPPSVRLDPFAQPQRLLNRRERRLQKRRKQHAE